jgi:hypothetical protein
MRLQFGGNNGIWSKETDPFAIDEDNAEYLWVSPPDRSICSDKYTAFVSRYHR